MTQRRVGQRYSLWLMPTGEVYERFAQLMRRLSAKHVAPEFPPHLTLLGGIIGQRREVLCISASLAACIRPFTIRLGKIDYLDEYFRCLFVLAARTTPLLNAHRVARDIFGHRREPSFMPHLSLLYGDFSRSVKEAAVAELGPRLDLDFKVRTVVLYSTRGEPRRWRCVAKFGLE
jgi:2'-5' RNA ligase